MAGSGITQAIYDRVVNSFDGMTRQELKTSLNLTSDQVRCRTNDLVKAGKLVVMNDEQGVPRYYDVQEKKMDITEAQAKDTPEIMTEIGDSITKSLIRGAEQSGFDKGFSRGYATGVKESQREAYEAGKRAVLKKLEALLS